MTIVEWYNRLLAEKAEMAELDALTSDIDSAQELLSKVQSPSKVADWTLWLWVFATMSRLLEVMWNLFRIETTELIARDKPHTLRWYATQAEKFQYGHELVWDTVEQTFHYEEDDAEARIVTHAAATEPQGIVRIKGAKTVADVLTPLSVDERNACAAYLQEIKDAGVQLIFTSTDPDYIKWVCEIDYDVNVLNPDGSLIDDPLVFPVHDAIDGHMKNLPFNGDFVLQHVIDKIQAAKGVQDIRMTSAQGKYGGLAYATINWRYRPDAGYVIIDPAFPLTDTITYIPTT